MRYSHFTRSASSIDFDAMDDSYFVDEFSSLFRWLGGLWTRRTREAVRRRDIEALRNLPDYLLRDIGVTRSDIPDAVRFGRRGRFGAGRLTSEADRPR
jgi:uncharacterized protein YjiS (DUF1127 family)